MLYKYRWAIERLFKHLKSSGFNIEKSRVTMEDRFAKLVAVLCHCNRINCKKWVIRNTMEPIKIKMNKGIPKRASIYFTYGLAHLKLCLNKPANNINSYIKKSYFMIKTLYSFNLFTKTVRYYGSVYPSLREELRSNSTKQSSKKF